MKRSLLALFVLGFCGCAHDEVRPQPAACSISEVTWPSSPVDYNKAVTAATLDKLIQVIHADRDALRADPNGQAIGAGLTQLNSEIVTNGPFIAQSALTTATRFRQLECAVQRGNFHGRGAEVDHVFADILGEVDKELQLAKAQ